MAGALLFDLDGVLVDSRAAIASSVNAAFVAEGLPPVAHDDVAAHIGTPLHSLFEALLGARATPELVDRCVAGYRATYSRLSLTETRVVEGIREALTEAGMNRRLAVATTKPAAFSVPILEALSLRSHFAAVAAPPLDEPNESKTVTVGRAMEAIRPDPAAAMIGDRRFDIEAAHAHGLFAIGVLWGYGSREELESAGADAIVSRPADLPAVMREL